MVFLLNSQLEKELLDFNKNLRSKYKKMITISEKEFKSLVESDVGRLIQLEKPGKDKLMEYEKKGGIVGVDGSVNKKGGAYPHFVELFQGLAMSTKHKEDMIKLVEVSSPLLDRDYNEAEDSMSEEERDMLRIENRNELLASIEIKVALESVRKYKPYAILMDGSLLRFHLYTKKLWTEFKETCEKEGVIVVGVIEEIKTQIISKQWAGGKEEVTEDGEIMDFSVYDKEMLFGRLNYGEMLIIRDGVNTKREWTKGGIKETIDISSGFLRSALSPNIIGIDILGGQRDKLEEMASLVFGLTPENSRGIPLWLDLVDREVKITNVMMEALLEKYIDRELYERLFIETRSRRTL